MDPDPEGDKEGEGGVGGNKGFVNADDKSEKDTAWSFVSLSLEKETKDEGLMAFPSPAHVSLGGDV